MSDSRHTSLILYERIMRKYILLAFSLLYTTLSAQTSRLAGDLKYKAELSGQSGTGDHTPFWQTANRYGLAETDNNSGYLRASLCRDAEADSLCKWRIGYGADLAVPVGYGSHFILQQLYTDVQYRYLRLSIGQKERPAELKNRQLSTGSMGMGTNARPLPQIRLEFPDFIVIHKTQDWIALKGHLAYGWYTDNQWQREFNAGNNALTYSTGSLYHSKAGFMRIGNKDVFPITVTGGIEMVCQFGGTVWNHSMMTENSDGSHKFGAGLKEYLQAFVPTGSDVTDGDNPNVMGNQVGSWLGRVDYHGKGWGASFYADHYFEDHSQLGWDFAWKDMLYGAEVNLPRNRFVSTIVYEHMRTTDQSGPIFLSLSDYVSPIGGQDNYYNHALYGCYQHAGFVMGNPLLLSPAYNEDGRIFTYDNRLTAHHFGISGNPSDELSYRLLFTHEKSLGTYDVPHDNPRHGNFLLVEATYTPHQIKGLAFTASYGQNGGNLLGKAKGAMLTVSYSGMTGKRDR